MAEEKETSGKRCHQIWSCQTWESTLYDIELNFRLSLNLIERNACINSGPESNVQI